MRIFTLLILLFIKISTTYAQSSGFLLDNQTKQAIEGATLTIKDKQEQAISSKDGSFQFAKLALTDSLVIQHINYVTTTYPITQLKQDKVIYLHPKTLIAPQATIQPKKYKKGVLGYRARMKKPTGGWYWNGQKKYSYGKAKNYLPRKATRIYNDYSFKGYIKKIRIAISKKGKPTTPFGLRLFSIDPFDQSPDTPIIDSLFIVQAKKGKTWAELDISKLGIPISPSGLFVSFEYLPQALDALWYRSYTFYDSLDQEQTRVDTFMGQIIKHHALRYKDCKDSYWFYGKNYPNVSTAIVDSFWWNANEELYNMSKTWKSMGHNVSAYTSNSKLVVPTIQVEVAYYSKNKKQANSIELEQDSLSYQKLSKKLGKCLFDVPKLDNITYNQSSPKELLASIKKGIINSNWQYVLYHLCIYPSSFVKDIAQKCKKGTNNTEFQELFRLSQQEHHQALQYIDDLRQKVDNNLLEKIEDNIYSLSDHHHQTIYFYFNGQAWYMLPISAQE